LVGMIAWMSFLVGPPLIGWIGHVVSLRLALALLAGFLLAVAPLTLTLRRPTDPFGGVRGAR
ncbi:MAG: hypothetical protein ACXVZO_09140, partial [Gaiellaceae bacterium]